MDPKKQIKKKHEKANHLRIAAFIPCHRDRASSPRSTIRNNLRTRIIIQIAIPMTPRNRPSSSLARICGPHLRWRTAQSNGGHPAARPPPRNLRTLFGIFSGEKELLCEIIKANFWKPRPSDRIDEPSFGEVVVFGVRRRKPAGEAAEAPGPAVEAGPVWRAGVGRFGRRLREDRRSLGGRFEGGSRHLKGLRVGGTSERLN